MEIFKGSKNKELFWVDLHNLIIVGMISWQNSLHAPYYVFITQENGNRNVTCFSSIFKDALGTCVLFEEGPHKGKILHIFILHIYCCVVGINCGFFLNNFCLILLKEKQKMVLHWSTSVTLQENWWCNESSSLNEKTAKVLQVSQHSLSHCGEKLLSFQSNIVNITIYYTTLTFLINFNKLFLLSNRKTQFCLISCSFTENILCTTSTDSCPSVFTF